MPLVFLCAKHNQTSPFCRVCLGGGKHAEHQPSHHRSECAVFPATHPHLLTNSLMEIYVSNVALDEILEIFWAAPTFHVQSIKFFGFKITKLVSCSHIFRISHHQQPEYLYSSSVHGQHSYSLIQSAFAQWHKQATINNTNSQLLLLLAG